MLIFIVGILDPQKLIEMNIKPMDNFTLKSPELQLLVTKQSLELANTLQLYYWIKELLSRVISVYNL